MRLKQKVWHCLKSFHMWTLQTLDRRAQQNLTVTLVTLKYGGTAENMCWRSLTDGLHNLGKWITTLHFFKFICVWSLGFLNVDQKTEISGITLLSFGTNLQILSVKLAPSLHLRQALKYSLFLCWLKGGCIMVQSPSVHT